MNIFIVYAGADPNSFNTALKDQAVRTLTDDGHRVTVSDLYKMEFRPVAVAADYAKPGVFPDDVLAEMKKFEGADLVIFNFPLWWYSIPAIMKGWVDRVFASGFAYGGGKGVFENGVFKGKKAMLTFTTGSPENLYGEDKPNGSIQDMLFHIHHGMLRYVGMEVLEPFIAFSPGRVSDEERKKYLEDYSRLLKNICSGKSGSN
jgi:NAD(P)H dehydrogenase (quinone)